MSKCARCGNPVGKRNKRGLCTSCCKWRSTRDPTPEEIAERCRQIREENEQKRLQRYEESSDGRAYQPYVPKVYKCCPKR